MNSLSWFIYLADVVSQIGGLLSGLGIVCGMATVLFAILAFTSALHTEHGDSKTYYEMRFMFKKYLKIFLVSTLTIVVVNIFIPSKNTMLMIAASQTTEQVANSPQGQEVLNNLKDIINKKLQDISKDK